MPEVRDIPRPETADHAEFFQRYLVKVPADAKLGDLYERQPREYRELFEAAGPERLATIHPPSTRTPLEVFNHTIDTERVLSYRLLRFGQADPAELAGFDQDLWFENANVAALDPAALLDEFDAVRTATRQLVAKLPTGNDGFRGKADGRENTVAAYAWIIAAHAEHHLHILRERLDG